MVTRGDFIKNYFKKYSQNQVKETLLVTSNALLCLLLINLLAGNLGLYLPSSLRFCALLLFILLIFLNCNPRKIIQASMNNKSYSGLFFGIFSVIFCLILLFGFNEQELWLLSIPILFIGIYYLHNGFQQASYEVYFLIIFSLTYALLYTILQNVIPLYVAVEFFSQTVTQSVGILSKPVLLSAFVSGFWIYLTFVLYILIAYITAEKRNYKSVLTMFIVFTISWLFCIVFQSIYEFTSNIQRFDAVIVVFLIQSLLLLPFIIKNKVRSSPFSTTVPKLLGIKRGFVKNKWKSLILICLLLCSGVLMTIFIPTTGSVEKKNIAIYQQGISVGGLDLPQYGNYGRYASGFFGLLPQYLNASGYLVDTIQNISSSTLEKYDVIIFININETFSQPTLDILWNYVRTGGSLLVLGDHTDIGGIMNASNILLKPVGIQYRFDSAIPIKEGWVSSYHFMHHPIVQHITRDETVSTSVGASLNIDSTAGSFPIIYGKGGFSDKGKYNESKANLGDYAINPGELVGDVILVAGAYYGNGRVIAFGDTSAFQNLAQMDSSPFIINIFTWLTGNDTTWIHYCPFLISLILLGFLLVVLKKIVWKNIPLVTYILIFSMIGTTAFNSYTMTTQPLSGPLCLIDYSHGEQINSESYTDNGVSGLGLQFARNEYTPGKRYLPLKEWEFSEQQILHSKILVFIAPTTPITSSDLTLLKKFMETGGLIILSVGYDDKKPSESLLRLFNLDLIDEPLGPLPYTEEKPQQYKNQPRFVDAWPIQIQKTTNTTQYFYSINYSGNIYPLVIFEQYGKGGFLLIADSQYLLDKNLESLYDYWPGNIDFFANIIKEIKNKGVPA